MSAALCLLVVPAMLVGLPDPDGSVESARDSLDEGGRYPWYDADNDRVRRIDFSESREQRRPRDGSEEGEPGESGPAVVGGGWGLQVLGWLVVAAALVGVGYLLVRAYLMYRPRTKPSGEKVREADDGDDKRREEALPASIGPENLLGEARRCYEEGDYGRAIVYLFSHQLVRLDRQQLIHLTKGKTNRQYLRELGPRLELRQLLEQTMLAFEEVFFGHRSMDRAGFEACWSRLDEFETLSARATG